MDELIENLTYPGDIITMSYKKRNKSKYDVIDCRNGKSYKIWSIRNDKKGFPHFLIYDNNQWKWQSAKHFKPIEEDIK